jgi:hypothetical protein
VSFRLAGIEAAKPGRKRAKAVMRAWWRTGGWETYLRLGSALLGIAAAAFWFVSSQVALLPATWWSAWAAGLSGAAVLLMAIAELVVLSKASK